METLINNKVKFILGILILSGYITYKVLFKEDLHQKLEFYRWILI